MVYSRMEKMKLTENVPVLNNAIIFYRTFRKFWLNLIESELAINEFIAPNIKMYWFVKCCWIICVYSNHFIHSLVITFKSKILNMWSLYFGLFLTTQPTETVMCLFS